MASFPDISGWGNSTTGATVIADIQAILAGTKQLPGAEAFSDLTINSGVVVATGSAHRIDTEGAASTDNLDKIQVTNVRDGSILVLRPVSISRKVTVRHMQGGAGQVYLVAAGSYTMEIENAALILQLVGTTWYEIARVNGVVTSGENQERFNSSGTFIVPTGITTIFVSGVGGGGGGAGGAGSQDEDIILSADGSDGQASTITGGISFSAAGGLGGYHASSPQGGEDREQGGGPGQNAYAQYGGYGGASSPSSMGVRGQGGHGGRGGTGGSASYPGGGGGGGGGCGVAILRSEYSVTPGAELTVTIGSGGAGGNGGSNGSSGSSGAAGTILIEW